MRGPIAWLPLPLLSLILAGCPAPTDPDLEKPCASRRAPSVTVGTGSDQFQPIGGGGVLIQTGAQGGNHIWIGVSCRGLGPDVTLSYGIRNATGADVSGPLEQVVQLQWDQGSDTDQAAGIYGYLNPPGGYPDLAKLVGQQVTIWADAADGCHSTPIHAEAVATVTGFAN
jgi:hypothetical protein